MKIRKWIVGLAVASLGMLFQVSAAGPALFVNLVDGSTSVYLLSEKPAVTFDGSKMNITASDASASIERAEVKNITFVDNFTSVRDLADETFSVIGFCDGIASAPGKELKAFSLQGKEIVAGEGVIDMRSFESGIYIVSDGVRSLKVVVR